MSLKQTGLDVHSTSDAYDEDADYGEGQPTLQDPAPFPADPVFGPSVLSSANLPDAPEAKHPLPRLENLSGQVAAHPTTAAVIVAGGIGSRFRQPGGKQLVDLLGKPVLTWSAEAFDAVPDVGLIVVVCPQEHLEEYRRVAFDPFDFVTPVTMVPAGEIRQESSMAGVAAVPETFEQIAIHDGARPLVTPSLIMHAISVLKGELEADGVLVGHPAIDTLKVVRDGAVVGTPDRSIFWDAQTPQIFRAPICRRAFAAAMQEGFVGTDDSSLVERIGGKVLLVNGPRDNLKLTVPEDLAPVRAALKARIKGA